MNVKRDLSHEVCVIRELLVFGRENFVFLRFFRITDSKRPHGLLGVNGISVTVNRQNLTGLDKSSSLTSCTAGLATGDSH